MASPEVAKFKIALCQLKVTMDKEGNIARARKSIANAAQNGAKLVVLPEMWNCPYSADNFSHFAENLHDKSASPSFTMLSEVAQGQGITIVGGSIPERCDGRLYNTNCIFGTDGKLIAKHRKVHLFDVNIPGDISFKESDSFTAGDEATIVDTGAHLTCYPGAFNMSTGEALWELVQRARAADNQLFVATCSPARESSGSYMIWGHSTLVGPFGEILATTGHTETTVIAEVNYSMIQLCRENLPLENQRRGDIYKFVDIHESKNAVS